MEETENKVSAVKGDNRKDNLEVWTLNKIA
jgi:hypothetical protein